jgi:hypothetical protein
MYHYGFITKKEYTQAVHAPIKTHYHGTTLVKAKTLKLFFFTSAASFD